jgi:hypothetical protein
MTVAVGYYLRLLLVRQSALAPVLTFVAVTALVYAAPAGPPLQAGGVTAAALFPVAAWLTRTVSTAESPPYAAVTLVTLGSSTRRLLARSAAALVAVTGLAVVAVCWGAVANGSESYPLSTLLVIFALHLSQGAAGVGVGTLVSPPMAVRPGLAVTLVTLLLVVSLAVPWFPPVQPLIRATAGDGRPTAGALVVVVAQAVAVGALALLAADLRERRGRA